MGRPSQPAAQQGTDRTRPRARVRDRSGCSKNRAKIRFSRPISTQTLITFYLQLRIDFRLFLLVLYSKAYLYTILNLHINSWSHGCTSFYSRNPESTYSRILFRFLTHLDFVVCFRSKHESCRDRRNLSIPTNLTSFHPPQPENFVSQYFRSYGVNPRCTRARFFKSKFLW